jgi:hypothetical protein
MPFLPLFGGHGGGSTTPRTVGRYTQLVGSLIPGRRYGSFTRTAGAFSLTGAAGAYTLTGQAADLRATRILRADAGSYTLTGQTANLLRGYRLIADAGAYTLTGQAATLLATRRLSADAGSYVLAGQDADLDTGIRLQAEAGSFTLTGQSAGLLVGHRLTAEAGAYTLTGQAATLARGRFIAAEAGAFVLTGQDAAFIRHYRLTAEAGAVVVTGQAATLRSSQRLRRRGYSYNRLPRPAVRVPQPPEIVVAVEVVDAHRDCEHFIFLAMGGSVRARLVVTSRAEVAAERTLAVSVWPRRVRALEGRMAATLSMGGDVNAWDEPLLMTIDELEEVEA